jgi:hypothetical protein
MPPKRQARRGVELAANDRNPRGWPLIARRVFVPSPLARHPQEGREVLSSGTAAHGRASAEHSRGKPKLAAITAGVIRPWQRRRVARSSPRLDAAWEQRLERIAARVEHLAAELEDSRMPSIARRSTSGRTSANCAGGPEPEQLARELGGTLEGADCDGPNRVQM